MAEKVDLAAKLASFDSHARAGTVVGGSAPRRGFYANGPLGRNGRSGPGSPRTHSAP